MFHSRKNNTKTNNVHERCLWLISSDKNSSYDELLEKAGSVSIHHREIQRLELENGNVQGQKWFIT